MEIKKIKIKIKSGNKEIRLEQKHLRKEKKKMIENSKVSSEMLDFINEFICY